MPRLFNTVIGRESTLKTENYSDCPHTYWLSYFLNSDPSELTMPILPIINHIIFYLITYLYYVMYYIFLCWRGNKHILFYSKMSSLMFHNCLSFASLCCFDVPVGDAASASLGGVFGVSNCDVVMFLYSCLHKCWYFSLH